MVQVGKAYTLFGATQLECDEWIAAISRAIDRLNKDQTVRSLFTLCHHPRSRPRPLLGPALRLSRTHTNAHVRTQTVKNGWLEKKGQKRYFVIKNGKLLWFNRMQKDDDAEANGYLLLDACAVSILPPVNGKYSLRITSEENAKREYTLIAASEADCSDWVRTHAHAHSVCPHGLTAHTCAGDGDGQCRRDGGHANPNDSVEPEVGHGGAVARLEPADRSSAGLGRPARGNRRQPALVRRTRQLPRGREERLARQEG
jgi:hypothetical protein